MRQAQTLTTFLVVCLGLCFAARGAFAQQKANSNTAPDQPKTITLQQKVEPSFRIEPVVQRFSARRGEVIPFEFLITSTGREMDVELKVVDLRQEESGIILQNEDSAPSSAVVITTPGEFTLAAGDSKPIRGEITVPNIKSNYHSFGILVRDKGQSPQFRAADAAKKTQVQAGVRFVTQYVLRCDIEVETPTGDEIRQLKLEEGGLVAVDGLPVACVYLNNPTNSAFECQVRATLRTTTKQSQSVPSFPLGMHSRNGLPEPEKFLVRIMPQSKLRLEAPLSASQLPREGELLFVVNNGRRDVVNTAFPTKVQPGQFAALETLQSQIDESLTVSPSQIMLSQERGKHRTAVLKFTNSSPVPRNITLDSASFQGEALPALQLSHETIEIPAGRTQTIRLTMRSQLPGSEAQVGFLSIRTAESTASNEVVRLPVALYSHAPKAAEVDFSELVFDNKDGRPVFRLVATNRGLGFVPIHGVLEIVSEQGQKLTLTAGHGKWLFPNTPQELNFVAESPLSPGSYETTLTTSTYEHLPPKTSTKVIILEAKAEPAK